MSQWYIRFPGGKWIVANEHQKDAVNALISKGGNAQTINVKHTQGGMFSAQFDEIKYLANNELFTSYTPVHAGWDTCVDPASGKIYYGNKESKQSQWEFPPADLKVEMTYWLPTTAGFANRTADFGGGGGNLNYRKNKISINLHNRSRNRYRSHRYRKNKHINLYKRARKGTRRLS